jgi:hypothetical protein
VASVIGDFVPHSTTAKKCADAPGTRLPVDGSA